MTDIVDDTQFKQNTGTCSRIPIIRTPVQIVKMLKEVDPETAITTSGLYRLVHDEKIKATRIGNRYLLDYRDVLSYYGGGRDV